MSLPQRLLFRPSAASCARGSSVLRFVSVITIVIYFSIALSAQSGPATVGQWSSVFSTSYEPIHVMVLPSGKVLFWALQSASLNPQIWDPATGTVTPTPLPGYQLFCAGHSFLADNQILVTGGNLGDFDGVPNASLYDPGSNTWTRVSDMNAPRWYPTNTTLSNGDVLVTSGDMNSSAGVDTLPQVWQAAQQSWRDLTTAQLALALYPRMFLAPNGKVFYATPDSPSRYLDTSGTGSWTAVADLNFNSRDYDTAVMYAPGKILTVGGSDPPTATAEVIDLNAGSPAWRYVGSMAIARRQLNGTILADGRILITGGSSGSGFDNASAPVYLTEMWDPATETFTPMASITQYRGYHSTAVLLPDGRVLSAGGDVSGATAEIFSPPYLFNGARPTISSGPTLISYGQTFSLATPDSANIAQVNLIRLSSVTHSFNQDQRINSLSFTVGSGTLNVTSPANGNLAPPGPYMLFILNGNGVPSVAQIIQLTSDLPPKAVATAKPTSGPIPLSVAFSGTGSTDPDGTVVGYLWDFGDGQLSTQPSPNHTYTSAATYTVTLTVTDNAGSTASQTLLITATVAHPPPPLPASVNPSSGTQGATLSIAINGSNFQSGAACGFGSGINVSSCAFNSTSQLIAILTINPDAPLGPHDVTVVNPDLQSGTLVGGFLVNPPPSVSSLSPSSGGQGQLITVIINGSNFQSGAACSFGAGTTVNSCAFNSTSQLTAQVSIRATASLGPRDVTVTNPDNSSGTLKGGFSVTPSTILLIQEATFSLEPSSSGTVTLTLPQPTAAGHTLIVGVSFWPLDVSSVTDGSGDTFKRGLPTSIYHNVSGSPTYNNFYYAYTAGGANSFTLNFSGGSTYLLVAVAEVAGLDSAAPLDQTAYNESLTATPSWSSTAVTTTAANEYLFSWAATEASNLICSIPGSGWTIESQTNSGGATVCSLDLIVSATGSYQASVTASIAENYGMEIVTFVGGSSNQPPSPPTVYIDAPASGATVSGIVAISGWAVDNASAVGTAISSVQVKVDGSVVGTATYGSSRPDVCAAYPGRPGCPNVGYSFSLNTSTLSAGAHTITVTATDSDGTPDIGSSSVTVNVQTPPPTVYIDAPASGATVSGIVAISGWALDNASTVGTAISSVQVKVDGSVVGTATYGSSRSDVCAVYPGRPGCPNVGYSYSLNTSTLSVGSHTITVTATDSDGTPDLGSSSVTVNVQTPPPTVYIDAPASGATVSGIVTVSGWAVDNASVVGTAINSVQVKVDGSVVGTATYGSSRSDVCAAYPGRPGCPNVGYSFSLNTSTLSAGTHTITVTATDSDGTPDSGSSSVTVTVQTPPPTVYIDAPASGATVSGIVMVSGWAVDNASKVGTAISNVQVKVDGTVVGTATYGSSRSDVCAVYPGRPGCPNVGYSYSLDTSTLSVGAHTITVTATDSDGTPDTGSASVTVTH